jgi:hypothetical protein
MFKRLSRLLSRRPQRQEPRPRRQSRWLEVDLLERRDLLTAFTPGNLVVLQAGDGTTAYNAQAPLTLDEITTGGTAVQGLNSGNAAPGAPAVGAVSITGASENNTTVTITTGLAAGLTSNGFTSGEYVAVSGVTPGGYDGTFQITVTGATTFTYTAASNLGTASITGATATPGMVGNQAITLDLSAAAGNGQLTRSYDGSALTFDGVDSTINNGGLTSPATPTGQNNRDVAVLTGDPAVTSNYNVTTFGPFYVGDDNRGSVAESPAGPIYTAGHPNQAGGAVSQGVHYFATEGASSGTQISASTNIRGVNIGFDNRMYFSTASGLSPTTGAGAAGIFTEAPALPTDQNSPNPATDIEVAPALFSASKLGGLYLADMNGDGILDNGDRLYFLDDGTVGGAGTGGVYVSTWDASNTGYAWNSSSGPYINHWGLPVRLGDSELANDAGSANEGQLRGLTATILSPNTVGSNPLEAQLYTTAFDNAAGDHSYVETWGDQQGNSGDTHQGFTVGAASEVGTTVTITLAYGEALPSNYSAGDQVQIDGVGASGAVTGVAALNQGYNGAFAIQTISADRKSFTYIDTNSGASNLSAGASNQGSFDETLAPSALVVQANGSLTIGGKNVAKIGLRGVSFAPVAATGVSLTVNGGGSATVSPGTNVTFVATLANSQVGVGGLVNDTVSFIDQNTNTVIGQATVLNNGGTATATLVTSTPLVGNHTVKAYFAGAGLDALASANSGSVTVNEAGSTASTTTLASNLTAVAVGKPITLTATVSGSGTPTGTVTFYNGSVAVANIIGTSSLATVNSKQQATLTTSFATAGGQPIIAVYNGDNTFAASQNSPALTISVAANATATITASANNVAVGSVQTYTATLNGNATLGSPGGSVVFTLVSATTDNKGNPLVTATSAAIALAAAVNGISSTALWTGPALTKGGSYFVTVSYTASGASNPYTSFAVNTTSSTNGVALIETATQAFTPGNLVAVRRGDGTINLGSSGYLVFLDEYTTGGTLVQSIALPNANSGSTHALLLSGQNGAEGLVNRSANGLFLTLGGYDINVGHTFVTSTFPYQFPRTLAEINLAGNLNTSTAISATAPTAVPYNTTDVVSNDGGEFWVASNLPVGDTADSGILFVGSVGASSATQIGPTNVGAAAISISGGQLYVTKGAGDIQSVGSGLPTSAGQTLASLPGLHAAYDSFFPNAENPEQVLLLNTADGTSINPNVAYIADQSNGLLKFWFDGSNWQYGHIGDGTFGQKLVFAGGVTGVTGFVTNPGSSAQVQLYVTGSNVQQQNPNQIDSFVDTNGAPGTTGASGTVSAGFPGGNFNTVSFVGGSAPKSPNANENFAGIAFVPGYTTSTTLADSGPGATNTFTATVTSQGGNVPTGEVVFAVDGTTVGEAPLNGSGVANLADASFPTTGSHVITAAYQGDVKDGTSTGTLTQAAAAFTAGNLLVDQVGVTTSATISSIAESGTTATVTTTAAHGFVVGQAVTITGTSVAGWNGGSFTITKVPTSTTFTVTDSAKNGAATGGTATLSLSNSNGTAASVVELPPTLNAKTVQTVALPTTGAGAVTEGGSTTTAGYVTDSSDGHTALLGGYSAAVGASTSSATGTIGVLNPNGSIESSTQIASGNSGGSVRAVASADGLGFWVATGNFVQYVPFGNTSFIPTATVSNFFSGPNAVAIAPQGQLYLDGGAGAQPNGVPAIDGPALIAPTGTANNSPGLPNNPGQVGTVLQGFPTARDASGNFPTSAQFVIGPDGNTIFVADSRTDGSGGILEYTQSTPGNWVELGGAQAGTGADSGLRGLTADFSVPGSPVLYGTTSAATGNRVVKITGATLDGQTAPSFAFTTVATAAANTAFRGVALAPTAPGATASTTSLSVGGSPAAYGTGVTLTATVTGSGATPTGWVSFQAGGVEIGSAPLDNTGKAAFVTTGNLNAAAYSNLTAVYTGNATYASSSSAKQSGTVNQFGPTVTLSDSSGGHIATGVVDTLTATVSAPAGTAPTGTVTFWDGTVGTGTNLGTATLSQIIVNVKGNPTIEFVATLPVTFSTVATHNLSAVYSGDTNFGTKTGTGSVVVVNPTTTTVTTSNTNPTASPTAKVTLTAGVTSTGSGTVTGSVQFYDDLIPIGGFVNLASASATIVVSTALLQAANGSPDVLTPGLHSISAVYSPDSAAQSTFFGSTGVYQQGVQDQPFGAGDQFLYRVGDGTTPLNPSSPSTVQGSIGSTVFVDEYTPAGALVQSLALPTADSQSFAVSSATESGNTVTLTTVAPNNFAAGQTVTVAGVLVSGYNGTFTLTGATSTTLTYTDPASGLANSALGTATGAVHAVVGNGQQSSTGQMSLSGDGQFLFVAGYDNNPLNVATALPIPTASGSNVVPRSVARVKYDGTIQEVAMTATNSGSGFGNFNAVYSPDGNQFYVGGNGGVVYYRSFSPSAALATPTATMTSPTGTTTALETEGGNLALVGPPGFGNDGPQVYAGYPTAAASVNNLAGFSDSTATGGGQASTFYIDAYFTHLNGTNAPAGVNTMYLSDDGPSFAGGAITKWALVNGTWQVVDHVTAGSGNSAVSFYYVSGQTSGSGNVTLYVTYGNGGNSDSGPGQLYSIVDTNGYNATIGTNGSHSNTVNILAAVGSGDNSGLSTTSSEVFRGVASAPVMAVTGVTTNANTTPILSVSESGNTVTVFTDGAHAFVPGQSVAIQGEGVAGYNGTFAVASVIDATDFTYTDPNANLANSGAGTATSAAAPTAAVSSAASSGTTATITTSAAHGFTVGQTVIIANVSVAGYNGTFTIASVPTTTTFTYTTSGSNLGSGSGGSATLSAPLAGPQRSMVDSISYTFNQPVTLGANAFTVSVHPTVNVSTATESSNTVTITTAANHNFVNGQVVTVAGVTVGGTSSAYNGTFTITVTGQTTFTYTDATSGLANADANTGTAGVGSVPGVSYASPDGGTTWVATFTGVTGNSIADGAYDIALNPSAVTYNFSGATLAQSNRALDTFYRLYGDLAGNQTTNAADTRQLGRTFGLTSGASGYNAALDYSDIGAINAAAVTQFKKRFGVVLSGFTPTI